MTNAGIILDSEYELEREYWIQQLQGYPLPSCFYAKHDKHIHSEYGVVKEGLPSGLSEKINGVSKGSLFAVYILLVSGVKQLLSIYSNNSEDIVVGMPLLGVEKDEKNDLLALRTKMDPAATFRQLLNQVKQTVVEADKHPNVSYKDISKIMNKLENKVVLGNLETVVLLKNVHETADLDLSGRDMVFAFNVQGEAIDLQIQYNNHVYSAEAMASIGATILCLSTWSFGAAGHAAVSS